MVIGVPQEIKDNEYRVGLVPAGAHALVNGQHQVLVQRGAGQGSGISDEQYRDSGAVIVPTAQEVYQKADIIIKVKEPLPSECKILRENQVLFTFLHLAPNDQLTKALMASGCVAVAYETIEDEHGHLPILTPMSEVAGRLAPQMGAFYLGKKYGGRGVLLSGVPGVERGVVTVIGGGVVGSNAIKIALGLGAQVYVLDINPRRLAQLENTFGNVLNTMLSNEDNIARLLKTSDIVIGAVLLPGERTPWLVTQEMISQMQPGSVVVDVSIDQGGCFETSHPTTHQDPVFEMEGVVHYCVANMPGIVSRTSTYALTNVTLPYLLSLANKGLRRAIKEDVGLASGINICRGKVTCRGVAQSLGCACEDVFTCLN